MPRHHYKGSHAVYIGMGTPFTSERPRRLCRNRHSAHFGMTTPFGRNLQITADRLADFMIENRYLGKYRLNLAKTNGQTLVRISKCSHGTCPTPEESLAEFPGLQRKQI